MSVPWVLRSRTAGQAARSQMRGHLRGRTTNRRKSDAANRGDASLIQSPVAHQETARRRRLDADPPFAVKALPEIRTLAVDGRTSARMIGMGVEPVDRVHARVREPCRRRHGR